MSRTEDDARRARLAAALRENLKRRKAKSRAAGPAGGGSRAPSGAPEPKET